MAKKKKVVKKARLSPPLPVSKDSFEYSDVENGDCFLYNGDLYIKDDSDGDQFGVSLVTGKYVTDMCGKPVIPVDVEIKWKVKK